MYSFSCFDPQKHIGTGAYICGPGNITNLPPAFMNEEVHDYRLSSGSPCINAGTNQEWMAGALDLGKNPRIDRVFNQVDMGCYEYTVAGSIFLLR